MNTFHATMESMIVPGVFLYITLAIFLAITVVLSLTLYRLGIRKHADGCLVSMNSVFQYSDISVVKLPLVKRQAKVIFNMYALL